MSDFRYEIKTPLPVIWLENIDTKKIRVGSVRNEHTVIKLILVDLVDDDEVEELLQRLTMRDLKKWKNINTHPIDRSSLSYFTLASAI